MNKHVKTLIKVSVVAALLYFLIRNGFISLSSTKNALLDWKHSLPAVSMLLLTSLIGPLRWQLLLRAQGIQLPLWRVVELTFIGNFFNVALPGAVSGDFVKAFYIGKEIKGQTARSFGSILFDRVAGLSALVLVAATALLFEISSFGDSALIRTTSVFVWAGAAAVLVFCAYLFLVRESHDPVLITLRSLENRCRQASAVTRIYLGLRHYHNHRVTVLKALLLSILAHLAVGWACFQFAAALGENQLDLTALYLIVPLGMLVTAVPVGPAGIGTGHAAFHFLFGLLGSSRGADIFTLLAMSNLLIGGIGGIFYLRFRHSPGHPDPGAPGTDIASATSDALSPTVPASGPRGA